jgi:hypothetical protein
MSKPIVAGLAAAFSLTFAASAHAALVVRYTATITNTAAFNGFESADDFYAGGALVTYSEGGITVSDNDLDADGGVSTTAFNPTQFTGHEGDRFWYTDSERGYTSVTLTAGGTFDDIEFLVGSGRSNSQNPNSSYFLHYTGVLNGAVIDSGTVSGIPNVSTPFIQIGFSGETIDELRLTVTADPDPEADRFGAGAYDSFRIGASNAIAAPEPGTWALMIAGFALAGGALRRRQPMYG